ncbi:MAG: cation-translocating P-type ATPase [Armatimonadota bacterium]|nr:cation-translocating P-type ATPase [Armatimonadota bacterium]
MSTTTARYEMPVGGMDCADCALKIERVLQKSPGVRHAQVSLATERATVEYDPARTSVDELRRAVQALGYTVPAGVDRGAAPRVPDLISGAFLLIVALAVLGGLVAERLGWAEAATRRIPAPVAVAAVLIGGWPIFRRVVLALRAHNVTPHALMTLGIVGALAIGEYGAAAVIVFFMRVADFLDAYTAGRARQAIRGLVALQPLAARVERDGVERVVPAPEVSPGDVVLVKPGERIPVDGLVISGRASVNQAPITGESIPVEREPGQRVLAATVNLDGVLRVRTEHIGADSTFGRIVRLVEEAEAYKSRVQRFADRVTAYYVPVVVAAAALAWFAGRSAHAAVAVLVVSCSCGIALATPVAVLAAVGRAARRGILIKGGAALEALARADTVLLDKTGTLTVGQPHVTGVYSEDGRPAAEVLRVAASAERYSEHPLAAAVVAAARSAVDGRGADTAGAAADSSPPAEVEITPGRGVVLRDRGRVVAVGSRRFLDERGIAAPAAAAHQASAVEADGQTAVFVAEDGAVIGVIALADRPRAGVGDTLAALRRLGVRDVTMLTGDNARAAAAVARDLGIGFRAELLPEDKIAHVRRLQAEGRTVAMIGDGINDAPALAQADVGVAMDAATGAALEAADVALMQDDWTLVTEALRTGRAAFAVIRQNLLGAVTYNVLGIALAVAGLLPPIAAAAAQIVPDILILLNSSRLLRTGRALRREENDASAEKESSGRAGSRVPVVSSQSATGMTAHGRLRGETRHADD